MTNYPIIEGLSLFVYQAIILWTLCGALGRWAMRCAGISHDLDLARPLGFGLAMALVPWVGLTGLGRTDLLWESIGLILFVLGVWRLGKARLNLVLPKRALDGWALAIPCGAVLLVLFSKRCYLLGGINNTDEFRSLLLVGSFANSGLMPSFPFDASAPLSYSYGVFAVGGLLYRMVHGVGYPAISVLVINAFISIYFFRMLYSVCRRVFQPNSVAAFAIVATTVTFYGFDFLMIGDDWGHVEWWTSFQIAQAASQQIFVYHYVWAGICCLVGAVHFHSFLVRQSASHLVVSALFFVFAALSGAITFVWGFLSLFGVVIATAVFETENRNWKRSLALRWSTGKGYFVALFLLCALLLLPQVFTYAARDTLFTFSIYPRYWESREFVFSTNWVPSLLRAVKELIVDIGPFLMAALVASWFYWLRPNRSAVGRLAPFLGIIATGSVLMTFSFSSFFDWTARGFLVTSLALPFVFAHLVLSNRTFWNQRWVLAVAMVLLAPQAYNFFVECKFRSNNCASAPEMARAWNQEIPFETYVHAKNRGQVDMLGFAGRAMVTSAHNGQLYTYLNNESFLTQYLGWNHRFLPCQSSRFGKSTPSDRYWELSPDGKSIEQLCQFQLSRR
jgi:hypothetical protein